MEAIAYKHLFVIECAVDTVDTASESVAAVATTSDAAADTTVVPGAISVTSSLISTATIVTTPSASVSHPSAVVLSTAETDIIMDEETVSPTTADVAAVTTNTVGSPQSGASSISSPEQSTADILNEHATDAAMTIPLVREPGTSSTSLHIKPAADAFMTAIQHADTNAAATDGVGPASENGGDVSASIATSTTLITATATVSTTGSNVMSAVSNDTSTEPISDEVCMSDDCLLS